MSDTQLILLFTVVLAFTIIIISIMNKRKKKNTQLIKATTDTSGNKLSPAATAIIVIVVVLIVLAVLFFTFFRYFIAYKAVSSGNTAVGIAALSPEIGSGIASIFSR